MRKLSFVLIMLGLCVAGVDLQAQKNTPQPKANVKPAQPAAEKKPKTNTIDSLIDSYMFAKATELIDQELEGQPNAQYTAALKARKHQATIGSSMLEATQKVVFIDSQVVGRDAMLKAIVMHESCGHTLTAKQMKDLLNTTEDPLSTAFVNNFGDHAIFCSKTKNGSIQLKESKHFGDKWTTPTLLRGLADSTATQGFPFLMADGITLYFAAKSSTSLGGYDIYVTRLDAQTNTYLKPENIGMPFNSPANDYLMAIDEANKLGYFVTDRRQPADKVCIYTFIPAETRDTYEGLSENQLRNLATIHTIKASQEKNTKAVEEALARLKDAKTATKDKGGNNDFTFDVAYGKRYQSLNDFKNQQAKEMAHEWATQKFRHEQLATMLRENRRKYAAARSDTERNALAPVILRQEQELEAQNLQLSTLANKVRSLENN